MLFLVGFLALADSARIVPAATFLNPECSIQESTDSQKWRASLASTAQSLDERAAADRV
jgi:hypothetical protein